MNAEIIGLKGEVKKKMKDVGNLIHERSGYQTLLWNL